MYPLLSHCEKISNRPHQRPFHTRLRTTAVCIRSCVPYIRLQYTYISLYLSVPCGTAFICTHRENRIAPKLICETSRNVYSAPHYNDVIKSTGSAIVDRRRGLRLSLPMAGCSMYANFAMLLRQVQKASDFSDFCKGVWSIIVLKRLCQTYVVYQNSNEIES